MDVLVAQVRAENGWITLSGEVEWDYQRQSAKDAVRSLLGVVGVSDDISVKPKASMSAVKSEIEAALKRRANVWAATQSCRRESRGSPGSSWAQERANDDALKVLVEREGLEPSTPAL
jgi:BON domain